VEQHEDKSNPNGRVISGAEKLEFELLKTYFRVHDFFTPSHLVKYSWDNHRTGVDRVMARLDWFYTFASSQGRDAKHIKEYRIFGGCLLSDHQPVECEIELQSETQAGSRYIVNWAYLSDPTLVAELVKIWQGYPSSLGFFGKIRCITKWY
jgi:hypothetical protein